MKLLIEVWGTMYQDWNNELFRWDTDNYLKLTLEGNTVFSGQFSQLEQSAEFQYVLESYAVKEFLPSKGFESLDFIVTIADFIADKELPSKESVKLEVGLNNYKGKKISFKSYEFPFYIMENADTTGRAAVVVTFSDRIEENKIANFSFRDY